MYFTYIGYTFNREKKIEIQYLLKSHGANEIIK